MIIMNTKIILTIMTIVAVAGVSIIAGVSSVHQALKREVNVIRIVEVSAVQVIEISSDCSTIQSVTAMVAIAQAAPKSDIHITIQSLSFFIVFYQRNNLASSNRAGDNTQNGLINAGNVQANVDVGATVCALSDNW